MEKNKVKEYNKLRDVPLPIQIRLRLIESLLVGFGYVNRDVLGDINCIKTAAVARDLALYKKLNPNSCLYNASTRRIERISNFKRIFK